MIFAKVKYRTTPLMKRGIGFCLVLKLRDKVIYKSGDYRDPIEAYEKGMKHAQSFLEWHKLENEEIVLED